MISGCPSSSWYLPSSYVFLLLLLVLLLLSHRVCVWFRSQSRKKWWTSSLSSASHYGFSATATFDSSICTFITSAPSWPMGATSSTLAAARDQTSCPEWTDYYARNSFEYMDKIHSLMMTWTWSHPVHIPLLSITKDRPPSIPWSSTAEHSNRRWLGIFHVIIKLSRRVQKMYSTPYPPCLLLMMRFATHP